MKIVTGAFTIIGIVTTVTVLSTVLTWQMWMRLGKLSSGLGGVNNVKREFARCRRCYWGSIAGEVLWSVAMSSYIGIWLWPSLGWWGYLLGLPLGFIPSYLGGTFGEFVALQIKWARTHKDERDMGHIIEKRGWSFPPGAEHNPEKWTVPFACLECGAEGVTPEEINQRLCGNRHTVVDDRDDNWKLVGHRCRVCGKKAAGRVGLRAYCPKSDKWWWYIGV